MRNSSGSRKLKKAALGLRQNMRRSRRYWRQPSTTMSDISRARHIARGRSALAVEPTCEFEVDILERRASDAQLLQALPACERLRGQLCEQRRRVVGLALDQLTGPVAVGDAIVGGADAQLAWRA